MNSDLLARVRDYLATHHVATLATMGSDGPWAAAVFYVADGASLYFLSSPKTRHCCNLKLEPRVAVTIQDDCSEWSAIKGVQLAGTVSELAGAEETLAKNLYAEKYAFLRVAALLPAALVTALARVRWYRIDATRCYFIDNSVAFGRRDEIELG